jgi:spectinomycin phosphotransferase
MLEKPDIPETSISACVEQQYGLVVRHVDFLPLGYDPNTAVYKVETEKGLSYFLKLRKGIFQPVSVELPKYLTDTGVEAIIAPLNTLDAKLYGRMDQYTTILYPFIPGNNGYEVRLSNEQWIRLGHTFRRLHETPLPEQICQQIPREIYDPQWRNCARDYLLQINHKAFTDPIANQLAIFIRENLLLISRIIERAAELAQLLQGLSMEFVLCHNDAHPGNFHVTEMGDLFLVDWDTLIFASRERDLMYFGGGMSGDLPGSEEERLFYQGYGSISINKPALAYYRYERIVQDIVEFYKHIILAEKGDEDRIQSYQYFVSSFQPGAVVEAALRTDDNQNPDVLR